MIFVKIILIDLYLGLEQSITTKVNIYEKTVFSFCT